jgi:hypothetical protein
VPLDPACKAVLAGHLPVKSLLPPFQPAYPCLLAGGGRQEGRVKGELSFFMW